MRTVSVLFLLLAACGRSQDPTWIHLARGGTDESASTARFDVGDVGGLDVAYVSDDGGSWFEARIPREAWNEEQNGAWTTRIPFHARGAPASGASEELFTGDRAYVRTTRGAVASGRFPPGHFLINADRGGARPPLLILRLGPAGEPAATTTVRVFASLADRVVPGRVNGRRISGDGIVVWPGHTVEREVDIPRGSVLRFATSAEPAVLGERTVGHFRVLLDGERVFEHSERNPRGPQVALHSVELPARRGARLAFEVDGTFGFTAFLAPVIGPAEVGTYGARPWGRTRPDVVVFQADTFRADNMRTYGSKLPLTPFLDDLASRSLVFSQAWSVATYTMPAHAAMFAGMYPRQTGATTTLNALPEDIWTIAERFAERGYRTGAITDAVVVSQENNLDQGFEWFDELHGNLENTRRRIRSFLDADDGRPTFLFIQSYRAHTPYVVSKATRERLGGKLHLAQNFNALSKELQQLAGELGLEGDLSDLRKATKEFYVKIYEEGAATPQQVERYEETIWQLEQLYRGGSSDVDEGVRHIHADLMSSGLFANGWFVFLSDHGEAFNEHDKVFHGGKVWNETTRIPFFLSGPGVEPGVVDHPVSLVDLAPTLADIAGLPTDDFLGNSLLSLDVDRPIFTFENQKHEASTFAVIEDGRKVMGYETPERRDRHELFAAFDLEEDPAEANDLSDAPPEWAAELLERLTPFVRDLSVPRYGSQAAPVDPARLEKLNELGYGGGG